MSWFKKFVFVFCVICAVGILLFGFFFSAILLADFIHLRPDVICGLMVVGCLVIATVMVLIEAVRDER